MTSRKAKEVSAAEPAAAAARPAAAGSAAARPAGPAPKKVTGVNVPPRPAPNNEAPPADLATVVALLTGMNQRIGELADKIATVEEKLENAQPPAGVVEKGPADAFLLNDSDGIQKIVATLLRNESFWKAVAHTLGALAVLSGRGVTVLAAQCVQVLIDSLKAGFVPKDLRAVVCKGPDFDESALRSVADHLFGCLGKGEKFNVSLPSTFQKNKMGGPGIAGELRRSFFKNHLEGVAKKDSESSLQFVNRKRNADNDADSLRKIDEEMQHLRRHEDSTTFSEAGRTEAANIFRECFSNAVNLRYERVFHLLFFFLAFRRSKCARWNNNSC